MAINERIEKHMDMKCEHCHSAPVETIADIFDDGLPMAVCWNCRTT